MTVGGGGWGVENIGQNDRNGTLYVNGAISEANRGMVRYSDRRSSDGYNRQYSFDDRLVEGILPGDLWLRSKYVPIPSGWVDYKP